MSIVVVGAAFLSSSFVVLWWALSGRSGRAVVAANLNSGLHVVSDMRQALLAHSARDRALSPAIERLARRARRLTPGGMVASLERRILLAGAPDAWTIDRTLAAKLVLGGAGALFGSLKFLASGGAGSLALGVTVTTLGLFTPDLVLYNKAEKRQESIQRALPDTIDQITISVEAGLGFEAALARAGQAGEGPLADELIRTLQDSQAGMSRADSLRRLVERTNVPELRHFVVAMLQAESYGVPIAKVLRVQSKELRIARRQRIEEKAMKLPVKILFPLVLCIFPCIFLILLGPAAIRLADLFSSR
jgi:tight adherence protein C